MQNRDDFITDSQVEVEVKIYVNDEEVINTTYLSLESLEMSLENLQRRVDAAKEEQWGEQASGYDDDEERLAIQIDSERGK